jgi:PAS domain S-box-containing protein
MLLIPSVGSLIILSSFYFYLNQTKDEVLFTNVAGRQRMLSEQLGAYAHMVHDLDQEEDREPLRELVAEFDQSLVTLDRGGVVMGRRLSPAPPEIRDKIDVVKQLWIDLKPALLLVADQPISSPQAVKAYDFIQVSIPRLRDLSNEVVFSFELLSHKKKEQIFRILIIVLSINFVLLFTGILITKRYMAERKKAAAALRESKVYAENILSSMTDALFVVAPDATIQTVNTAACVLLDYTEEEFTGMPIGRIFEEEEEEEVFTKHILSMVGRKLQVIHDRDPEDFWSLLKTGPLGVVIVSSDGKIVMVNKETASIFGYDEGELIGEMIHMLLPAELRDVHEKERGEFMASPSPRPMGKDRILKAQRKDGTTFEVEVGLVPLQIDGDTHVVSVIRDPASKERWEYIRLTRFGRLFEEEEEEEVFWNVDRTLVAKNGEKIPVLMSGSVMRDETGKIQAAVLVAKDITERKRAEEALRESEEKFRGVIEQSNDGIYVLQGDRFVFINPRFTEITGFKLEEISAEDFDFKELVAEEGLKVLEEREAMRQRGEEPPSRYVFKGLRKDGEKRDLEVSVTTIEWQGAPATLGVLRDVTERIQTRTELEQALEKAQEGERVKSLFLANMSHEIRTPLNAILGFTDLIEASTRDLVSDEEKEFFDRVKQSGQRLMRTVHEILDISQIEAGTYNLKIEQLDLCNLVREIVHECQPMADKKSLKLKYKTDLDSAFIQADPYGVSQAIINIIDNAIKFTEQGRIAISLKKRSENYVLTIQDTGIGISEEYIDSLFEAFTQESEGYTKKFQGIGLGMAITKHHLDLNKVDIQVESTKGVGTTFILTFNPVKKHIPERQVEKAEAEVAPTPESAEKPLVLLVEDDLNSQKLTEFYLKGKYDICFAVSVDEAKQQLKKHPVDLILLDLSLVGNEDGLDLVRWMRKTKTWQKTPVVATTAHAFTKDLDNCLAAGCNDYLSKPIKKEKLLDKISEFV